MGWAEADRQVPMPLEEVVCPDPSSGVDPSPLEEASIPHGGASSRLECASTPPGEASIRPGEVVSIRPGEVASTRAEATSCRGAAPSLAAKVSSDPSPAAEALWAPIPREVGVPSRGGAEGPKLRTAAASHPVEATHREAEEGPNPADLCRTEACRPRVVPSAGGPVVVRFRVPSGANDG